MISIEILTNQNIIAVAQMFLELGKTAEIFNQYVHEQLQGQRITWIAHYKDNIAGYICLLKNSLYEPFQQNNIPEIKDLNVILDYRKKGIAS